VTASNNDLQLYEEVALDMLENETATAAEDETGRRLDVAERRRLARNSAGWDRCGRGIDVCTKWTHFLPLAQSNCKVEIESMSQEGCAKTYQEFYCKRFDWGDYDKCATYRIFWDYCDSQGRFDIGAFNTMWKNSMWSAQVEDVQETVAKMLAWHDYDITPVCVSYGGGRSDDYYYGGHVKVCGDTTAGTGSPLLDEKCRYECFYD